MHAIIHARELSWWLGIKLSLRPDQLYDPIIHVHGALLVVGLIALETLTRVCVIGWMWRVVDVLLKVTVVFLPSLPSRSTCHGSLPCPPFSLDPAILAFMTRRHLRPSCFTHLVSSDLPPPFRTQLCLNESHFKSLSLFVTIPSPSDVKISPCNPPPPLDLPPPPRSKAGGETTTLR
jgi:hypothetical protein